MFFIEKWIILSGKPARVYLAYYELLYVVVFKLINSIKYLKKYSLSGKSKILVQLLFWVAFDFNEFNFYINRIRRLSS